MNQEYVWKDTGKLSISNITPNYNITFHNAKEQVGVLDFNGPEMVFSGNMHESAKLFFDWIAKSFKQRLEQDGVTELEQENRLLRARNDRLEALVGSQPTQEQIVAGAKALGKRSAESCGIDEGDQWKFYSEELIEDSRAVLTAAFNLKG